jgi:streptogramin lyase
MNPLERRRSGSASRAWGTRERSGAARRRSRRPVLEDLESRQLLSAIGVIPVPTTDALPSDITAAPDGDLWFTESGANQIGMLNPTTDVITEFPLPSVSGVGPTQAAGITAGPDGNIWFGVAGANAIGMINPTTGVVTEFSIPTANANVQDITAGPDGNLWFTESGANAIGMLNPTTDVITQFPVPTGAAGLEGITAGPDGNLWFTEQNTNAIGMLNPTTDVITQFSLPTAQSQPFDITAGPDGNVWFTEYSAIGMINLTTDAITQFAILPYTSGTSAMGSGSIAVGPDGNLWFAYFNDDAVGRINPTTDAITQFEVPLASPDLAGIGGPYGITAGPDGDLWFTLLNSDEIGDFNPDTFDNPPVESPNPGLPPGELAPPAPVSPSPLPIPVSAPLLNTTPPEPGTSFSFQVSLDSTTSSADAESTVTLGLDGNSVGSTLTVTTTNGVVDTISGLKLEKSEDGYRLIARATPKGPADVASTRTTVIATEKLLTAGKGKDKHVVGFEVALRRALDPTRKVGKTAVSLWVEYANTDGDAVRTVQGTTTIPREGPIVVIAKL